MQGFKDNYGTVHPIRKIDRMVPSRTQSGSDKRLSAKVYVDGGDEYGIEIDDAEYVCLEQKMSRVIPANPGFTVLMYHSLGGEAGEPYVSENAVLAWRENEWATLSPVIADGEADLDRDEYPWAIEEPNGFVRKAFDGEWRNRTEWRRWCEEKSV